MKNISKFLLSVVSAAILTINTISPSFAASTKNVTLVGSPMPAGDYDYYGSTYSSDTVPDGNWSTNGTASKYLFYSLSLPSYVTTNTKCIDGSNPLVNQIGASSNTISASPDDPGDGNYGGAWFSNLNDSTIYSLSPGGAGGGSGDTDLGAKGGFATFATPMSLLAFMSGYSSGSDTIRPLGVSMHTRDGSIGYSITTTPPSFSIKLSCDIEDGTEVSGSVSPSSTNSANSPKTGAGEVLLGTFVVALLASSFVIYKAIEKHRKTAQISEK